MSNGIDSQGANANCAAYQRHIREARAEDRSATEHYQQASKQNADADAALKDHDYVHAWRHILQGQAEIVRGDEAQAQADEHKSEAWKELAGYHAKMGHDPGRGFAENGGCIPEPSLSKIVETARDIFVEVIEGLHPKGHK